MYKLFISIIMFLVFTKLSKAQNKDTILLMNGNFVIEKVIDTTIGAVTIVNPLNSLEKLHYEYDQIYCVKYGSGFTDYYYTQDSLRGNYFTREEMLYYIYGERDARKGFKGRGALIGSGLVGMASGGLGLFYSAVFPYGYMALSGITKIKIKHNTVSNPNYIDYDAYIFGYERVSRSKRRIQSLIGGTVGLALGYGLYFGLLKNNLPSSIKLRF
jgi:hypothetical protein